MQGKATEEIKMKEIVQDILTLSLKAEGKTAREGRRQKERKRDAVRKVNGCKSTSVGEWARGSVRGAVQGWLGVVPYRGCFLTRLHFEES